MSARRHLPLLLAMAAVVLASGGCGSSGTKTVSVSSELPTNSGTQHASTTSTTKSSPTPTTTETTTTSTNGTGGAEATRTTTAPAFTKESTGDGEGLGAAVALVKAHGYTAGETSTYRPEQTLRVLVGTRTGSNNGYGQQAFFFVDGRYIGTDTSEPSSSVKVVGQSDTEVTLAYPLYKAGDPPSKPSGEKTVRFQLNNGHLVALGSIPAASARNGG
ncbi:MAG: LppP/LprE family lipoprotein [Solirubrobacteraceae bacterium]